MSRKQHRKRKQLGQGTSQIAADRMNPFCPYCGYSMTGLKLPLIEVTTCPHCSAEVTTQDISPNFVMFGPKIDLDAKPYLVTGLGPDGKEVKVRVTAVGELMAQIEAQQAGVRIPTDVLLESPPKSQPNALSLPRAWWRRVTVREHLLYAMLLAVFPGGGWVALGWMAADSPLGGVGALVANYLLLLACYGFGRWYRKPMKLSERGKRSDWTRSERWDDMVALVQFMVRMVFAVGAIYSMTVIGLSAGCLLGAVLLYPMAVIAKDKFLYEANVLACVGFYFTAGLCFFQGS